MALKYKFARTCHMRCKFEKIFKAFWLQSGVKVQCFRNHSQLTQDRTVAFAHSIGSILSSVNRYDNGCKLHLMAPQGDNLRPLAAKVLAPHAWELSKQSLISSLFVCRDTWRHVVDTWAFWLTSMKVAKRCDTSMYLVSRSGQVLSPWRLQRFSAQSVWQKTCRSCGQRLL